MSGPPKDVEGECNARLRIGDDWGDNHATMRCQLEPGHDGWHREVYANVGQQVRIEWAVDEGKDEGPGEPVEEPVT